MRILHITPVLTGTGGIEEVIRRWGSGLATRGHDVSIAVNGNPSLSANDDTSTLDIQHFPNRRIAGRYAVSPGLVDFLRRHRSRFDIVHTHQPRAFGTQLAALLPGVRPVITLHLHPPTGSRLRRARQAQHLSLLNRRASAFVYVSDAERRVHESLTGRSADRYAVVRPAVAEDVSSAAPLDLSRPTIVSVGRLAHHKRMDLVVRLAAELRGVCDVRIIGDGPERAALNELAASLGLDPAQVLLGRLPREELLSWLRAAAVLVSLSEEEAFGVAVLEGAAAGAGLLVSPLPSHLEILGLLPFSERYQIAPTSEISHLAQQLRWMVDLGRPLEAPALPTWDDSVSQLESAYEHFLGETRSQLHPGGWSHAPNP